MYGFFSRLFGSNAQGGGQAAVQAAGEAAITPEEENKTLSPSNSTELSQLGQVAGFVQGMLFQSSNDFFSLHIH